jgi:benzoate-CoA ligase
VKRTSVPKSKISNLKFYTADRSTSPPTINMPRLFNAAHDLLERNIVEGRAAKIAYIDDDGRYTYEELCARVNRSANALQKLGLKIEDRVMIVHSDTIDFPSVFLGAIKSGIIPIAVNTLLTPDDYEFMMKDSRAKALIVSSSLLEKLGHAITESEYLEHIIVSGDSNSEYHHLQSLQSQASKDCEPASTSCDDVCFWLYSSGSTGAPKGTVHIHSSLTYTAELYAKPILGIKEDDTVFSAAKLFFAYGLGNGLTFPLSVGATTVLMSERPTPDSVFKRIKDHQPTIFYGVPTLFGAMLASGDLPSRDEVSVRVATSAGEALPPQIGKRWTSHFGSEILDGIGSTEMLHIFLSNRPGDVRYGTTGKPVPGYEIRLVGEDGLDVPIGELGELQIKGPSSANLYWNQRQKSKDTFCGEWTRAGDKYSCDEQGFYTYSGRSDDMLKVSGLYVSPFEVEAVLMSHPAVLEAAIVGDEDDDKLTKPRAFIVLISGSDANQSLVDELKDYVKSKLAPFKYPRWIEFVEELPKTATGKIQRFRLRQKNT